MVRPRKDLSKEMLLGLYDTYKNWCKVAGVLGVSDSTVYRRLALYGIERPSLYYSLGN